MRIAALLLLAVLGVGCSAKPAPEDVRGAAAAKAARWLRAQQAADGGWHSATYGLLRSGQSLTPFVLLALLDEGLDPASADRAIAFLRGHTNAAGELGRSDPSLEDYPNYATSLAIRALLKAGTSDGVDRMAAALRRQQFAEGLGWGPDHPAHGAWGMGGPPRRPPHAGHVDLSMTRHALQATDDAEAKRKALKYLARCQNADGGFLFSTVVLDANKAGGGRSYGTATADGLLALLAAGVPPSDARVTSAREWLAKHHRVDGVPGFDEETAKWRGCMRFYYLAASAQVFQKLGGPSPQWRRDLVDALVKLQRPDGSFQSSDFLMKEDDPLIATTLALTALNAAR